MAPRKLQIRRVERPPPPGLKTRLQKTPPIISKWFILPETRVIAYIFATGSMGLRLLLFTQLSLKTEASESKTSGTKTEFGVK